MSDVLTQPLRFTDPRDLADLRTFATRAKSIDDGAIRLQASGPVLAAYVCVLRPRLLGESTPTILGLRTMALAQPADTDVTVPISAVLDRLARAGENDVELPLPPGNRHRIVGRRRAPREAAGKPSALCRIPRCASPPRPASPRSPPSSRTNPAH